MTADDVLATVIDVIRRSIDEPWIHHAEIGGTTRFGDDLEIESIEFLKIVEAVQRRFGTELDVVGWLSSKTLPELIALSVGDLAGHVATALPATRGGR